MEKKDLKAKRRLFNPTRARTGELLILLLIVSVSSICPIRFTCTRIFSFFCCIREGLRRTQGTRSELEKRAHCIGLKNCCCINRESDEVWSSRGLEWNEGKMSSETRGYWNPLKATSSSTNSKNILSLRFSSCKPKPFVSFASLSALPMMNYWWTLSSIYFCMFASGGLRDCLVESSSW